jgi:hypothetical protein
MVVVRDSNTPLASHNSCPNITALMKTVLDKDILSNHYLNKLSQFAVAHNELLTCSAFCARHLALPKMKA